MKQWCCGFMLVFAFASTLLGEFVHPGMYYNAAELDFARKMIKAKAEPWSSAGRNLESFAKLNWKPHAVETWDAPKDGYMSNDPVMAHAHALQWAITGDARHAAKAIEILNAWSSTLKTITNSSQTPQHMLACGWNGCHFANAAELLRFYVPPGGKPSGWSEEDIGRFKKMTGLMYDVIKDFKPDFNGNWDSAMMNTMVCFAVFSDDQAMFNRAVDHFHGKYAFSKTHVNAGHLAGYVLASGQCEESGRDQSHVQMGLGNYVALCEVAWKQGVDLYGDSENRLLLGLEYTAKYMLGHDDVPFQPIPPLPAAKISSKDRGVYSPIWETAYQHYVNRKGLAMPFTKQIIFNNSVALTGRKTPGNYRPEGVTVNAGMCWGTLLFQGKETEAGKHGETPVPSTPRQAK